MRPHQDELNALIDSLKQSIVSQNSKAFKECIHSLSVFNRPGFIYSQLFNDVDWFVEMMKSDKLKTEDLKLLFKQRMFEMHGQKVADSNFTEKFLKLAKKLFHKKQIDDSTFKEFVFDTNWKRINESLFKSLVINKKHTFIELGEMYEQFENLLKQTSLFKSLISKQLLSREDMRWIFSKSVEKYNLLALKALIKNHYVLRELLKSLCLTSSDLEKFYKTNIKHSRWCINRKLKSLFDIVLHNRQDDVELKQLIELNKAVVEANFNDEQRKKLSELLKSSEIVEKRLYALANNHLLSNFDPFESLIQYLMKTEKRNLLNL